MKRVKTNSVSGQLPLFIIHWLSC